MNTVRLNKTFEGVSTITTQNATYNLYRVVAQVDDIVNLETNDILIGTYITDAQGNITVENLDVASYYFKETAVSTGFVVDPAPKGFEITGAETEPILLSARDRMAYPEISVEIVPSSAYAIEGQRVTFLYRITNTGTVPLTNILLLNQETGDFLPILKTSLLPGEQTQATALDTYTVTPMDVRRGEVTRQIQAIGTCPAFTMVRGYNASSIAVHSTPGLTVVKTADVMSFRPNDPITYTVTLQNSGNTTLYELVLADSIFTYPRLPTTTLAPGESTAITYQYIATAEDKNRGYVNNIATARAVSPTGAIVSGADTELITSEVVLGIHIEAFVNKIAANEGEILQYTYRVTNTGNQIVENVMLTDTLFGSVSLAKTTLNPAETTISTGTYTHRVVPGDVAEGSVTSIATVTGTTQNSNKTVTDQSTAKTMVNDFPGISLQKSADKTIYGLNEDISYTFVVKNIGNCTLSDIALSDPMFGEIALSSTSLAPGESATAVQTYTITTTRDDIDRGKIVNRAIVAAKDPKGAVVSQSDTVSVPSIESPSLKVEKLANKTFAGEGEDISYTIVITNTGNTALTLLSINDSMFGSLPLPVAGLSAKDSVVLDGEYIYTVTANDMLASNISNTVTVNAKTPSETAVSNSDTAVVNVVSKPYIDLKKTVKETHYTKAGDVITYQFLISNLGNTTLTNIMLVDAKLGTMTLPKTTLIPGESMSYEKAYVVTSLDVDAGYISNTAIATGYNITRTMTSSTSSTANISSTAYPSLTLTKTAEKAAYAEGEKIRYQFVLTNPSADTFTLTDLSISDPMLPSLSLPANTTLLPGQSYTVPYSDATAYTVTATDANSGIVSNTATATGIYTSNKGHINVAANATANVAVINNPAISIVKTASPATYKAGETITYSFVVTNTGNVPLHDIEVYDSMFPGTVVRQYALLGVGESVRSGELQVTADQDDVDKGTMTNTASVRALDSHGTVVTSIHTAVVTAEQTPGVTIEKLASSNEVSEGDSLNYRIRVTNSGNVTLHNIAVKDTMFDPVSVEDTILTPGESTLVTESMMHTVTAQDLLKGIIQNTAKVTALTPNNTQIDNSITVDVTVTGNPAIDIQKTALINGKAENTHISAVGDIVTYHFTVRNIGDTTLSDIVVTDAMFVTESNPTGAIALNVSSLIPNSTQTAEASATFVVTQKEIDQGRLGNTAKVSATDPSGKTVTAQDFVELPVNQRPALTMDLSHYSGSFAAGNTVTYRLDLANTGNTSLKVETYTASLSNLFNYRFSFDNLQTLMPALDQNTMFPPGILVSILIDYVVTQQDVDAGNVKLSMQTSAFTPGNETILVASDTLDTTIARKAEMTIEQTFPENFRVGIHWTC